MWSSGPEIQIFIEEKPAHSALEALREADPDALSPTDALELLYHLKKLSD